MDINNLKSGNGSGENIVTHQDEFFEGYFDLFDIEFFVQSGYDVKALTSLSSHGTLLIEKGQNVTEDLLSQIELRRNHHIKVEVEKKKDSLDPILNSLISIYRSIGKEEVLKVPFYDKSKLTWNEKQDLKEKLKKQISLMKSGLMMGFNMVSPRPLDPNKPLYNSELLVKYKKVENEIEEESNSNTDTVIIAIDLGGSSIINNMCFFLQAVARQFSNYVSLVHEKKVKIVYFDHELYEFYDQTVYEVFGGTSYAGAFEYVVGYDKQNPDSKIHFILISDGMPDDAKKSLPKAKYIFERNIKFTQIIALHPRINQLQAYKEGKLPEIDVDKNYYMQHRKVFNNLLNISAGEQILLRFPEFLLPILTEITDSELK